jgi:hypothetical protein
VIVVLGSRHDRVAAALVDAWPSAALCSAEDLTRPGWAWRSGTTGPSTWVVDGDVVDDERITGVFVRRSAVYPEEFVTTHPDDRTYLAAEAHAFLVFVLASTNAVVVNPVIDAVFGEQLVRPERWMPLAPAAGLRVAPLRLSHARLRRRQIQPNVVEVVGDETFGATSARLAAAARSLGRALGLHWATFVFDGRGRLVTITTVREPGTEAVAALGRLLSARVAA